jgi:hypothetical protein
MAHAFHDRLGPGQLDPWVISLAERAVAVAAEDLADRARPIARWVSAYRQRLTSKSSTPGLSAMTSIVSPSSFVHKHRLEAFEVRFAFGARRRLGATSIVARRTARRRRSRDLSSPIVLR